jgi:PAS domain S-box-containing protein
MDIATGDLRWSASLAALAGITPQEIPPRFEDFLQTVHPADRERLQAAIADTVRTGAPGAEELRVVWADGSEHRHAARWRLRVGADGRRMLVGIVRDVGSEHHALQQTRFLAEVSAAVDRSLDLERTLEAVAELCVRRFADWCLVDVPDPVEGIRNVAVAHKDPGKVALAQTLRGRYPPDPQAPVGAPHVMRTGEPELHDEVGEEQLRAAAVDEEHLRLLLALDYASSLIVPLRARGQVLGTLTLVRGRERGRFSRGDLTFVGEVAARAAVAVDHARVHDELRQQRDLYEALLWAQSELGAAFVLLEGVRMIYVNAAAEELTGRTAAELLALPTVFDVLPEEMHRTVGARIQGAFAGLEPAQPFRTELVRADGTRLPIEAAGRALHGAQSGRMLVVARDISDRVAQEREHERALAVEHAARQASEAAGARVRVLADVSALLERSLTDDATLGQVADALAGRVADTCALDIVDERGRLRRAGAAARSARDRARLAGLGDDPRAAAVVEGAQAVVEHHAPADDPLGASVVLTPLVARGRAVGVLSLGWRERAHQLARDDWRLVEGIAQRIALAVDAAQQYRERAHLAQTLQASLLPAALPRIAGMAVAGEYLAAGEGIEVGGDFYDVFALGGDAWALVIGDVVGKGPEAAVLTALARYTLRALGDRSPSPGGTLALLNEQLLRPAAEERLLSAVLARVELRPEGGARLVVASGGHPPPVLLRADGSAEPIAAAGLLLGVDDRAVGEDRELALAAGDTLVLYTDGVTEARHDRTLTADALAAELARLAPSGPGEVARAVVAVARERAGGPLRDDLAVLVATIGGPEG